MAWLMPPLVMVGGAAAAGAYVFMTHRLNHAYDQDLGDIARALVPHLRLQAGMVTLLFTAQADAVLRADSTDQIFYVIRERGGRVAGGEASLPQPPGVPGAQPVFWNDYRGGQPIRAVALAASVEGIPVTVVAAETTRKRRSAENDAMLSALAPTVLLLIAAAAAVIFGVRRGLAPVEDLREQLRRRPLADLGPLDEAPLVEELRPLVHSLNDVLERLAHAQRSQARFIANAAHQLRTPIAGLVNQLDLARAGGREADAHLEQARQAAARLARLAQQVLSLAAADPVSNPEPTREQCDLASVVRERAGQWVAAARGVEMEFDLDSAAVAGNTVLIGELASNLVDNAARYGARNVKVATHLRDGCSILEVEDDGRGIPLDQRKRIFDRFHRIGDASMPGSGLGLAIVEEIARRHGASVEVDDARSFSRGARVAVSFPAASPAP